MKKTWLYLLGLTLLMGVLASCSGVNKIMRSGNSEQIYQKALEYYAAGKWSRATTLFESVQHLYSGSTREDSLAYFMARCKFKERDYDVAGESLDQFRRNFGRSVFIEDAEGMYALCFFYLSPGPSRDQTVTSHARMAINEFMSRYPESKQMESFQKMDADLRQRLHEKSYLNAYTYYKIGRYKSAMIALRNALKEYPDTEHREEIMYLITVSSHKLASNSVSVKQVDRYLSMLDSYYSFIEEYPESKYIKELNNMAVQAKDFMDRNNKEKSK